MIRRLRMRLARASAASAIGVAVVLLGAPMASAHTNFIASDPLDSAVLVDAPDHVTLEFSEELSAQFVKVSLDDADGTPVVLGPGAVMVSGTKMLLTLPVLEQNTYELSYDVRDPVDLHQTTGSVVFGIGEAPTITSRSSGTSDASLWQLGGRVLERAALSVLLGAVLARFVLRASGDSGARWRRRSDRVLCAAAMVLIAAEAMVFAAEVAAIGSIDPTVVGRLAINSPFGRRSLIAVQLSVGIVLLLRHLQTSMRATWSTLRRDPILMGFFGLVAALVLTVSYSGHDAIGGDQWVGLTMRAAHLAGVGVWAGGLAVLLVCAGPADRRMALQQFSPIAQWAALTTVISGLAMSRREVYSLTAAFSTGFGQMLAAKIALLTAVVALAVSHRHRLRRSATPGIRSLRLEAALLAAIVAGGAVLSVKPPAVGERFEPRPAEQTTSRSLQIDDVLVQVSIRPNRPGRNTVALSVLNTRRPAPAAITSAMLTLTSPTRAAVELPMPNATGASVDVGAVDLVAPGSLGVSVSVDRPDLPLRPFVIDWTVNPIASPRPATIVSDAPLADRLLALEIAVTMMSIVMVLVRVRRARRHRGSSPRPDDVNQNCPAQRDERQGDGVRQEELTLVSSG